MVSSVFVVVATILSVTFVLQSRSMKAALDEKADEYVSRISHILEIPLWNFDQAHISQIGSIFAGNELISGLRVDDDQGRTLFETSHTNDNAPKIIKSSEIVYEGKVLGRVILSVSQSKYISDLKSLLMVTLLTLFIALLVIALGTDYLLITFLRHPLASLEKAMDRVTAGDFFHTPQWTYRELSTIARRYAEMAETVHRREENLKWINVELQKEIAEHRMTEERLAFSNAVLMTQLENSPDGVLVVNPEGRVSLFNHRFAEMWEVPAPLLEGGSAEDLLAGIRERVTVPERPAALTVSRDDSPAVPHWEELRLKDGRHFSVTTTPLTGGEGKPIGMAWYFHDSTDQKRTEELLRENEARYRSLFEDSPISLWEEDCSEVKRYLDALRPSVSDLRAYFQTRPEAVMECMELVKVIDVNHETLKLMKAENKAALFRSLKAVLTDDAVNVFKENLIALYNGQNRFTVETTHRALTGEDLDVSITFLTAPGFEDTWAKVFVSVIDITERKNSERALRRSEEEYRILVENLSDLVVKVDLEGRFLFVSPSFCDLFGKSEAELIGEPYLPLVHEEDREPSSRALSQILHPPHTCSVEQRALTRYGWRWLAWSDKAVLDDEGNVVSVVAVGRDIHDKIEYERALALSEERFRTAVDTFIEGFAILDPVHDREDRIVDFRFTHINDAGCRLNKQDRDAHLGTTLLKLFPHLERHGMVKDLVQVMESGEPLQREYRFFDGDDPPGGTGSFRRSIEIRAVKLGNGLSVVWGDTTQKNLAEQALRMAQFALDRTRDAVFWITEDARFSYVNEAACEALGYAREELLQLEVFDLDADPEHIREIWRDHWEELRNRGSFVFESFHRRKNGSLFPVEIMVNLLTFEGKEFNCAFARDITERRRAEEELRLREHELAQAKYMLELVLNTIPVRIFWKDVHSRIIGCNLAFARDAGYDSVEEIIGLKDSDTRWRKWAGLYRIDDVRVMQTGKAELNVERPQSAADGRTIWLRTSKIPLRDPDGALIGVLGVYEDITESKQAQEALRRANLVLENSPLMLFRWRAAPHWPVELVSENVRQLGYTPEQLLSGEILYARLVHPEDLARVGREVEEAVDRGLDRFRQEYRIICHNGNVRWVEDRTFVERDDAGRVTHFQGIVMDITERRLAEVALRDSEQKFRSLFENMTEGVALHQMILDGAMKLVDYRILDVNPAYEKHTGLSPDRVKGALASQVYGMEPAPFLEEFGQVAATGRSLVFETYFPLLERHFQISVFSPGQGMFATVFEDITGRKQNEAELKAKNEEMERFVYTISHDLKSPLVTIQSFLRFLEQDLQCRDEDRIRRDMDHMHNAATRMNRLLNELLELSRIGRKINPPEEVLLQDLVEEALHMVAGRVAEKGVRVEISPTPILLYGDRTRLVEVFQNLIDNAAKFMGEQAAPQIWIGAQEEKEWFVLYVKDNGMGIDPRHLGKLFNLFEKLDPSSDGTGVGLALVKRIIETHSGKIWVESDGPGRGAAFYFTLPKKMKQN